MVNTITKIEVFRLPPRWVFIRVDTSSGVVGWGEGTLEGHDEAVEGAYADLASRFVGWDADKIEDIWQHAYRGRFYRGGPVLMSALAGLDIALWDIKGKTLGVSVASLLGGAIRDRIRVYGWVGGDKPSDVLEAAKVRKAEGFDAIKMNGTGSVPWLTPPALLLETVENLKAVRSLGLDAGVDFHGRVHKGTAKQLAKALEPYGPLFIEEPLLPTQPLEIADLAKQTTIPIALGERLYSRQDYRPYFEARCVDVAQPDIAHCGGISELRRIAAYAETYDVSVAPHCPLGPLAFAASLQVDAVTVNFAIQEMSWKMHYNSQNMSEADLMTYMLNPEVFQVKDGRVDVLQGPGLGIEINEPLVRETAKKYGEMKEYKPWRNPTWRGEDGELREW
ncbi:enolase C-terminal domain-like protein [Schizophyllum commune]